MSNNRHVLLFVGAVTILFAIPVAFTYPTAGLVLGVIGFAVTLHAIRPILKRS